MRVIERLTAAQIQIHTVEHFSRHSSLFARCGLGIQILAAFSSRFPLFKIEPQYGGNKIK